MHNYCVIDSNYLDKTLSNYFLEIIRKSFPKHDFKLIDIETDSFPSDGNVYICYEDAYGKTLSLLCDSKRITRASLFSKDVNKESCLYVCKFDFDLSLLLELPDIKRKAWNFIKNTISTNILLIDSYLEELKNKEENKNEEDLTVLVKEPYSEDLSLQDSVCDCDSSNNIGDNTLNTDQEYSYEDFIITIDDIFNEFSNSKIKSRNKSFDNFVIEIFDKDKTNSIVVTNSRNDIDNKISFSDFGLIVKAAIMIGSNSIKFSKRKCTLK